MPDKTEPAKLTKAQEARLNDIRDGRLYSRSEKTGTTQSLVALGLAEWLEHSLTGHVFARISTDGRAHPAAQA